VGISRPASARVSRAVASRTVASKRGVDTPRISADTPSHSTVPSVSVKVHIQADQPDTID
jgi:hypothetical protein